MNRIQDRIRGSLIGGAIGDALGYPVEFINSYTGIQYRYGERGITRLDIEQKSGKAVISDDTQMTLFTANGLLYKDDLELHDLILHMADDLYLGEVTKMNKGR
jgi:ADP-ribosylglycohydrolase